MSEKIKYTDIDTDLLTIKVQTLRRKGTVNTVEDVIKVANWLNDTEEFSSDQLFFGAMGLDLYGKACDFITFTTAHLDITQDEKEKIVLIRSLQNYWKMIEAILNYYNTTPSQNR